MKNTTKKTVSRSILCLLILAAGSAQAAMVNFTLTGQITIADANNPFGVAVGNEVTAAGVFDDSQYLEDISLAAGITYIDFSTTYNNMNITIGDISYSDSDDILGGPYMYFLNGALDGLSYRAITANHSFSSSGENDFAFNGGVPDATIIDEFVANTYIQGNWTASSYTVTAVPVPAATWLFGSGLVFLSGFIRSRRKQHTGCAI